VRAISAWHERNDRLWTEAPPKMNPEFTRTRFPRGQDLIDKYHPDLLYFDKIGSLPLEQTGLAKEKCQQEKSSGGWFAERSFFSS
jgi:alpha-L-fucosidase